MSDLRQRIKNLFPPSLWHPLSETRYALLRAAQWPAAMLHPLRGESIARLAALKDKHKGERCFIIGNGPSLKETDISLLKDEYTFGMNRIYLAFPEWGFRTSYLVSVNDLVIEQCARDLAGLEMSKFFSWRTHRYFAPFKLSGSNQPHFLFTTHSGPKFARDACGRLWEGATVTYVCLQLAFHMGFEKAILIGVDHSFTTQGAANKTVVSQGDDPNHFDPSYFGEGFRCQLPDLDASEQAYCMARQAYQDAGGQVVDATIGGKLQVFPKAAYDSLFD